MVWFDSSPLIRRSFSLSSFSVVTLWVFGALLFVPSILLQNTFWCQYLSERVMEECGGAREERTPQHLILAIFTLCSFLFAAIIWGNLGLLLLCEMGLLSVKL
jgi:hypothetical protein